MAETKKSVAELRKELKKMMVEVAVRPSSLSRGDLERMISVYGTANEKAKALPPAEKGKTGRKKAMEVEAEGKDGIAVPKKLDKPKTAYAEKQEKKKAATIKPGKLDDDSGSGSASEEDEKQTKKATKKVEKAAVEPTASKPKRTLTEEQKAKMRAGRLAKKGDDAAKPKKDDAPPDAPSKKEKPVKEKAETKQDDESQYIKLPVFRIG